jgi:hypothetical protein
MFSPVEHEFKKSMVEDPISEKIKIVVFIINLKSFMLLVSYRKNFLDSYKLRIELIRKKLPIDEALWASKGP